jgi:hypothetical protein
MSAPHRHCYVLQHMNLKHLYLSIHHHTAIACSFYAQDLAHKLRLMRVNPEAGGLDLDNLWMTPQEKADAKAKLKRMTRR